MIRGRRDPTTKPRRQARWTARSSAPRVHARGEARLDAMLALAEEATREAPLAEVLSSLCHRIASMLAVDVCSIYLREQHEGDRRDGELVLRATVGYPRA